MSNRRSFLELKHKLGTLTEAECAELERMRSDRAIMWVATGGTVVHALREETVEEWKSKIRERNDAERKRRAERERADAGTDKPQTSTKPQH